MQFGKLYAIKYTPPAQWGTGQKTEKVFCFFLYKMPPVLEERQGMTHSSYLAFHSLSKKSMPDFFDCAFRRAF
ncbi:MAG: hypothetical protein DBX49_07550 [Clostridia bacterium]|nr:MAG: hypothetical protein DBX49_07550 [Clostridia bacterium]